MDQHEKKVALLKKYYSQIQTSDGFEIAENIASKKIDNAIKKFASGLDRKSIIGFYDITIVGKKDICLLTQKYIILICLKNLRRFGMTI